MAQRIDMTGQRVGKLTVLAFAGTTPGKNTFALWQCRCDCGTLCVVQGDKLRRPRQPTRSCGCLSREVAGARFRTHGRKHTAEYGIYYKMLTRCTNPKNPAYAAYGGRGITVEWRSFEDFFHDMHERPSSRHTLERIDNDGPYTKANCRWATYKEQMNNTRVNHRLTFAGKTQTISQWATEMGINYHTLFSRLKSGWSVERALTQHVRKWPSAHVTAQ